MLEGTQAKAVELSALREHEVAPLLAAIEELDFSQFAYVSLHFPSRLARLSEAEAIRVFERTCVEHQWPLVVHPDVITDFGRWRGLGDLLCIENMDARKATGRFADDLDPFFDRLPEASFCFDFAHARQVDPTLIEARKMLSRFGSRLRQVHLSELNSVSQHERLSLAAMMAIQRVCHLIPASLAVVIESPVQDHEVEKELRQATLSIDCRWAGAGANPIARAAG